MVDIRTHPGRLRTDLAMLIRDRLQNLADVSFPHPLSEEDLKYNFEGILDLTRQVPAPEPDWVIRALNWLSKEKAEGGK